MIAHLLIYGTGGFAYGGVNHLFQYSDNFPPFGSLFGGTYYSGTKTGWTAGGGVEYAPLEFPNWSLKAEYLYIDLGKTYLAHSGAGLLPFPAPGVRLRPRAFLLRRMIRRRAFTLCASA